MEATGLLGTVTFDGAFVTIRRKGMRALINGSTGEKRLPIGSITGVQWKAPAGVADGFLQFTIPGGNEARGVGAGSAYRDENSMPFNRTQLPSFETMRDAIEQAISSRMPPGAPGPVSVADEIQKFAQLRDNGVISPEEFEAKKAQLLNS
jgi:hypothetical protein